MGSDEQLCVHFYNLETDDFEGYGFYLPNKLSFELYAKYKLGATRIDDNKWKHPNRNSYITLESKEVL